MKKHFSLYSKCVLGLLVLVFALSLTPWMSYGETTRLDRNNPHIRAAIEVQDRNFDKLRAIPGVVGAGTGIGPNGQPVIRVYTMKPGIRGIPPKLEKMPVEVKVTGMFIAYSDPTARFERPVPIGVSTGHPDITAGTIGCRVTDGTNVYALSNNHVYANINNASIGDSALQPGSYDGGQDPTDKIGELWNYEPIDFRLLGSNTMDAAIAISLPSDLGCSTPSDGYGIPNSETLSAYIGLPVQKYGRTTRLTHGQISEIGVTALVCYAYCDMPLFAQYAWLVDQIKIPNFNPSNPSVPFSSGGDSGSLIVTDGPDRKPVGLLFAGSDTDTLANRIELVLNRFEVTVDDCSGTSTNNPPTADFTFTPSGLTVVFRDLSSDSDGTVMSWIWNFGDGSEPSDVPSPTHTYAAEGTYTVTLKVTDDDSETDSVSKDVTVSESSGGIALTATGKQNKKWFIINLDWSGATSTYVDIYRDGRYIATTSNDGAYNDKISNDDSGGPDTYQVCEAGTSICSNETTVIF